jgi:hypothetical protein
MANLTDDNVVDFFNTDRLPSGTVPGDEWPVYIGDPTALHVYLGTLAQVRAALAPNALFLSDTPTTPGREGQQAYVSHDSVVDLWQYESGKWVQKLTNMVLNASAGPALPKPAPPTFTNFQDTQTGGSVVLVPATGVPLSDYFYRVTPTGNYQAVPPDGLITVDNIAGAVYAYSKATAARQQSELGVSNAFTVYTAPATGTTTPAAPTFKNFDDTANTVQLVPATGVPMADNQYKLGSTGTYSQAPADGIITVPASFSGQVFAYSVQNGTRNPSLTGSSPSFNTSVATTPTLTTPAPPTYTGFDDAANTVQLVPATGVPLSLYLYKLGANGTYTAAPSDGIISVPSTFAGAVYAYSQADSTRNASQPGTSQSFTAAAVLTAPGAPTNLVATPSTTSATPNIVVTATAPSSNGGATVTDYNVYRDTDTTALGSFPAPSGTTALTYTDTKVAFGAAHSYKFTAINSVGEGPKSAASNAATPTAPASTGPRIFQRSLNPGGNDGSITNWGAVAGTQFRYDTGFVADTGPQPASMIVCYQNANNQIGQLDYYGGDSGKVCAIYYNGVQYEKDSAGNVCTFRNSDLSTGTNLLIIG